MVEMLPSGVTMRSRLFTPIRDDQIPFGIESDSLREIQHGLVCRAAVAGDSPLCPFLQKS